MRTRIFDGIWHFRSPHPACSFCFSCQKSSSRCGLELAGAHLFGLSTWARQIDLQMILLLAIPGIAAVMKFAERGFGTPIPYDPSLRLVTSSIYRYCANPMQLSCALVLVGWARVLRSGWMLGGLYVGRLQCRDRCLGRGRRSGPSFRERMEERSVCGQKLVAKVEAAPQQTACAYLHCPELWPLQRGSDMARSGIAIGIADRRCGNVTGRLDPTDEVRPRRRKRHCRWGSCDRQSA